MALALSTGKYTSFFQHKLICDFSFSTYESKENFQEEVNEHEEVLGMELPLFSHIKG